MTRLLVRAARRRRSAAPLLVLAACGGDDAVVGPDAAQVELVGVFELELHEPDAADPGSTSVLGAVYDAAGPEAVRWTAVATSGDCVLSTPEIPFCATPCDGDAVCVDTDTCQAYPTKQDAGSVTITGLGDDPIVLQEVALTYQLPAGTNLAYPPFSDGDPVELAAGAFTIDTTAIAPLDFSTTALDLARDTALSLAWTPGDVDARFTVKLDISHHGGSRGKLECVTDDDGGLTIDAALITRLLDLGAAGYPTIIVSRVRTSATGGVSLIVRSEVERPVTVPGIESCTSDDDCTPPATCQDDLTCQ